MHALKAHVRNGYFVSDEPTDLPEGTEATLLLEDPFAGMEADERVRLEAELDEGARDFANGDSVNAREFLEQLRAKNP